MNQPSAGSGNKLFLGIRTDIAEASLVLSSSLSSSIERPKAASDRGSKPPLEIIDRLDWVAGRQLSTTLLAKIDELLARNRKSWADVAGVVAYQGPGSFTGLRIGLTVANTAAFTLNIPIVGSTGDDWFERGARQLTVDHFTDIIIPHYGAEPNITKPKNG